MGTGISSFIPALVGHYYDPWCLELKGIVKEGFYRYTFNGQSEKQKDLNGGFGYFYETDWRGYDPVKGRFDGMDKLTFPGITPYQYAWNNPVLFNDPTGLEGKAPDWGGLLNYIQNNFDSIESGTTYTAKDAGGSDGEEDNSEAAAGEPEEPGLTSSAESGSVLNQFDVTFDPDRSAAAEGGGTDQIIPVIYGDNAPVYIKVRFINSETGNSDFKLEPLGLTHKELIEIAAWALGESQGRILRQYAHAIENLSHAGTSKYNKEWHMEKGFEGDTVEERMKYFSFHDNTNYYPDILKHSNYSGFINAYENGTLETYSHELGSATDAIRETIGARLKLTRDTTNGGTQWNDAGFIGNGIKTADADDPNDPTVFYKTY